MTRDWLLEEQQKEPTMYTGKKRKFGMSVKLDEETVVIPEFKEFILNNEEILLKGVVEDLMSDIVGVFRTREERAREVFSEPEFKEEFTMHENPPNASAEAGQLDEEAQELMRSMHSQLTRITSMLGNSVEKTKKVCSEDRVESLETEIRISREKNQQLQSELDRQSNVVSGLLGEITAFKENYFFKFTKEGRVPGMNEVVSIGYVCHSVVTIGVHYEYLMHVVQTGRAPLPHMTNDTGAKIPEIIEEFQSCNRRGLDFETWRMHFSDYIFRTKLTELLAFCHETKSDYFEIFFNLVHTIDKMKSKSSNSIMAIRPDMLPKVGEKCVQCTSSLLSNPLMKIHGFVEMASSGPGGIRNTSGFFRKSGKPVSAFQL